MVTVATPRKMPYIPVRSKGSSPAPRKAPKATAQVKAHNAVKRSGSSRRKDARNYANYPGMAPTDPRLAELFGLVDRTRAGIAVDEDRAMTWSAFYAAVSLIAESMAILPRKIYKSSPPKDNSSGNTAGDREEIRKHPGWRVMNRTPDEGIRASYTWIETVTTHACVAGNGYSEIVRNGRGQAMQYHLLNPNNVRVDIQDNGKPIYIVRETAKEKRLQPSQMFHLKAPSWDGLIGKSPVTRARETIGLGLATEIYGSTFFGKGGRPSGFLTKPNRISRRERDTLQDEWEQMHGSLENALQVGVLSGGLDWKAVGMNNDDAQFLDTRKFQILEICRWFRIPPHMLAEMDNSKYSNVEHMLIEFVTFTMLPWIRRWESEFNMKQFTVDEQFNYYCEFQLDGLLRADSVSRSEALERQLRNGVLTPDEWRKIENRSEYADGIGAKPLVMASQLATLQDVAEGKVSLVQKGGSTDGDGTSTTPKSPSRTKKSPKKPN